MKNYTYFAMLWYFLCLLAANLKIWEIFAVIFCHLQRRGCETNPRLVRSSETVPCLLLPDKTPSDKIFPTEFLLDKKYQDKISPDRKTLQNILRQKENPNDKIPVIYKIDTTTTFFKSIKKSANYRHLGIFCIQIVSGLFLRSTTD